MLTNGDITIYNRYHAIDPESKTRVEMYKRKVFHGVAISASRGMSQRVADSGGENSLSIRIPIYLNDKTENPDVADYLLPYEFEKRAAEGTFWTLQENDIVVIGDIDVDYNTSDKLAKYAENNTVYTIQDISAITTQSARNSLYTHHYRIVAR